MRRPNCRFGLNPSDPAKLCRTLRLESYVAPSQLEYIPPAFDWFEGLADSPDLNDTLGDCVVAAQAKMVRSWTANVTRGMKVARVTDADILDVYQKGAGYDPADPSTDAGWDLLSALSYWKRTGIAGHKIQAYAAVNPQHHYLMRAAAYLFGGLFVAFRLPESIWDQMDRGLPWDVVPHDGGWTGNHAITIQGTEPGAGIPPGGTLKGRTWGREQAITWEFVDRYCFEAYAVLSPDYMEGGRTLAGLDVPKLLADLAAIRA